MPASIDASDSKLWVIGGAIMLLLTAGLAFVGIDPQEQGISIPSTYSSGSGCAHACELRLHDFHHKVSPWERLPTELPSGADHAVLIIADPLDTPTKEERAALENFVDDGGQVLFTGVRIKAFFPKATVTREIPTLEWKTFSADLPSNYTSAAEKIVLQSGATWQAPVASQQPLYGDPRSPVVLSWRIEEGRVLWSAAATPLTNAGITREGNLNLFLNAMNFPVLANRSPVQILCYEYFHGQRTSLWSYLQKTPVAWGLAQVAILGVIAVLTFGRRSGPIVLPPVVSRLSPLEFVDTLGGLYERAGAEPAVVGFVYQRFRATLSRQVRLPSGTSDGELADAVQGRLGWKGSGPKTTMARALVAGRAQKVAPEERPALSRHT